MKRVIFTLSACALASVLALSSCMSRQDPDSWSFSGDARITGDISANIKLAAFFATESMSFNYDDPVISNVANLGMTEGVDIPFVLTVTPQAITAELERAYIFLVMWEDADGDDQCDFMEWEEYAHSQAGDPAFKAEALSQFTWAIDGPHWYYEPFLNFETGARTGWNQRNGESYIPLDSAALTGAKIVNADDFL